MVPFERMGLQKKNQPEESAGKKWVIAGIAIRAPLKSIRTKPKAEYACEEEGFSPRTPTAREFRIPEHLPCPPAPRKPRPVQQKCHFDGVVESFSIQDLESMFVPVPISRRHV